MRVPFFCGLVVATVSGAVATEHVSAQEPMADPTSDEASREWSTGEVIKESIFGDVYTHTSRWQELSLRDLFSTGWNKPWQSPPVGEGGAPRQGWLNAYEGVFYRLSLGVFSWAQDGSEDAYTGEVVSFTPFNQRFELQTNLPIVSSNDETRIGDIALQGRLILSETRAVTQTLNVGFRLPTGDTTNGNGVAAVVPQYQIWTNWWKGLVVRGGFGFSIPYTGEISDTGARTSFDANLAIGYYFTQHDMVPIGDMVWYVATNLSRPTDDRASSNPTTVTLTPGVRTHLGQDWYFLGGFEVPVTNPEPFDHRLLVALMKVY